MVLPNRETYYLFIDNWTQEVVRIHVSELLNGDYYIGKFDTVIDKNYLGSEALMYNSVGRAAPVLWLLPETIFATDWEEV